MDLALILKVSHACIPVCADVAKAAVAEAGQASEYVKQIDELTRKLSEASSLITELQQQQVSIAIYTELQCKFAVFYFEMNSICTSV